MAAFHSGEREIQQKADEVQMALINGGIIADAIMAGAINFIEKQPMAIVSSRTIKGQIWTSLLIGDFGFIKVLNPQIIIFEKELTRSSQQDIFFQNISTTPAMGCLVIELASRRRYRVNGNCQENNQNLELHIEEAYPNCPKYIQKRVISLPDYFKKIDTFVTKGEKLGTSEKNWIRHADTFFIGSQSNMGKLDASHRGGNVGFITILEDGRLKIPDYKGNSMYNTWGNIAQNANVGLLFIDFLKGETLQLTGTAELLFNQHSELENQQTKGTGRFLLFNTEQWIHTENHHSVDWTFIEYSPFNP